MMGSETVRKIVCIGLTLALAALLVCAGTERLLPFGSFPDRRVGESIGKGILENAVEQTGAVNTVTAVIWDYRGYDTLGEAAILFTAAAGIYALFKKDGNGSGG